MCPNAQETADLVTFSEEILMENFIFYAVFALRNIKFCFSYDEETYLKSSRNVGEDCEQKQKKYRMLTNIP